MQVTKKIAILDPKYLFTINFEFHIHEVANTVRLLTMIEPLHLSIERSATQRIIPAFLIVTPLLVLGVEQTIGHSLTGGILQTVFLEAQDTVIDTSISSSRFSYHSRRVETLLLVHSISIQQPLQDHSLIILVLKNLFQREVAVILFKVLVKLNHPESVGLEQGVIIDLISTVYKGDIKMAVFMFYMAVFSIIFTVGAGIAEILDILPNACATSLYLSCNLRELIHMASLLPNHQ